MVGPSHRAKAQAKKLELSPGDGEMGELEDRDANPNKAARGPAADIESLQECWSRRL